MSSFQKLKVWAPQAKNVTALADGNSVAMGQEASREGWWTSVDTYPAGTRYGFIVDGEGPFPDPRSALQPDGVHGLSCLVDHENFEWKCTEWSPPPWAEAVVYELHTGTFSEEGTFEGAIEHINALVRLGVTHLEIMPVAEFPGRRGWGYDGVSIFAPHHAYGGVEGLKKLVDACHLNGLGVILDVVYNHMGPDGNYLPSYGPYFTKKHITPWGDGPNLDDIGSAESRRFFIDNALMWLGDYRIDGLRLDAIDKVVDESPKHLLVELREALDQLEQESGNAKILIAETASNDPIFVKPISEGGYGMHAQWNDDLHHSMRTFFTRENESYYADFGLVKHLTKALKQGFVYDGNFSPFRGKPHGKSPAGLPGHTFLGYVQTHDQVGNRALGDRFHQHENAGLAEQKVAAAFVLLSGFIPMIFMGEEWAASTPFLYFTDHEDPALAKAVSEGRRREFGGAGWTDEVPDPQADEAFSRSKLIWGERHSAEHNRMLGWYSELLRLRRKNADLRNPDLGEVQVEADPDGRWLWMKRGCVRIVAGIGKGLVETPLQAPADTAVLLKAGDPKILSNGSLAFDGTGVLIFNEKI